MGGGILPIAIKDNTLYFLFGKEVWDKKWSDFGGGREKNESALQTAVREGCEESNGFFRLETEVKNTLVNHSLKLVYETYTLYIFKIDYDDNLPKYFSNNHKFIRKHFPNKVKENNGFFEKSEVKWWTVHEMRNNIYKFRPFYREIIRELIERNKDIKNKIDTLR